MEGQALLGVAALQLETRPVPTAENLAHVGALLDSECRRLGIKRWDEAGSPAGAGSGGSVHLDVLVLPEIFNAGYTINESAWCAAEALDPARSPSLHALAGWAARYRCYAAATLLEATPDGHIYNSLVLAAPNGSFVLPSCPRGGGSSVASEGSGTGDNAARQASGDGVASESSSGASGGGVGIESSSSGACGSVASAALVRKQRASSLEGFVFRSAGPAGRGGEPCAHWVEVDARPLLSKRSGSRGSNSSGGGEGPGEGAIYRNSSSGGGGSSGADLGSASDRGGSEAVPAAEAAEARLRLGFSICYENFCLSPMEAIQAAHQHQPLDLLISPFCAMQPAHDHPTFSWPAAAAQRFAVSAQAVSRMHAAKLGVHVVAAHHSGRWASQLPRLLPFLARDREPITGPMLGCSAVYGPQGEQLASMDQQQEGLALARLPLLARRRQHPQSARSAGGDAGAGSAEVAHAELAGVLGAAAAASMLRGPAAPYARYHGGYCVEPASWHVRLGFPLMEALGSLSYHCWLAPLRRRIAHAIVSQGVWCDAVPPLEHGRRAQRAALAAAAAAGVALAAVLLRARRA